MWSLQGLNRYPVQWSMTQKSLSFLTFSKIWRQLSLFPKHSFHEIGLKSGSQHRETGYKSSQATNGRIMCFLKDINAFFMQCQGSSSDVAKQNMSKCTLKTSSIYFSMKFHFICSSMSLWVRAHFLRYNRRSSFLIFMQKITQGKKKNGVLYVW